MKHFYILFYQHKWRVQGYFQLAQYNSCLAVT